MNKKKIQTTLADVQSARSVLAKLLPPSPLLRNAWLSEQYGCDVYLKLESMQPVGSFKIRGATYRISKLSRSEKKRGVIAASAGNHAQGVAWGSARQGVDAMIVMPINASLMKIQNTQALGARVVLDGKTYDEAYAAAMRIARKTGRVFVHAYEDTDVIAGQGTVGLEILEQLPDVDTVVVSMGGGGLIAGVGLAIKELKPEVEILGCQAEGAPALVKSLKKGRALKSDSVNTFADGIAVGTCSSEMLRAVRDYIDHTYLADDEEIAAAVVTLMEKARIVTEGAAALTLATLEKARKRIRGKKVVLVICGGNIDVNVLGRIIDRGLIRAGRKVRVNALIPDRPGSLMKLTGLLAEQGVNILQAIHDRDNPSTRMDLTGVNLTLETRGPDHTREVIKALKEKFLRVEVLD